MKAEPKTLTTMDGKRVTLSALDIKAKRNIEKGVEVDTHAGETYRFPIARWLFDEMMVIDFSDGGNKVSQIPPLRY